MFSIFRPATAGTARQAVGRKRFLFCFLGLDLPLSGLTLASSIIGFWLLLFMREVSPRALGQMMTFHVTLAVVIDVLYTLSILSGHQFWAADNWQKENRRVQLLCARQRRARRWWHLTAKQWRCQVLFRPTDAAVLLVGLAEVLCFAAYLWRLVCEGEAPDWCRHSCLAVSAILAVIYTWVTLLGQFFQVWDRLPGKRRRYAKLSRAMFFWRLFLGVISLPLIYFTASYGAANYLACLELSQGALSAGMLGRLLMLSLLLNAIYTTTQVSSHVQWWFQNVSAK